MIIGIRNLAGSICVFITIPVTIILSIAWIAMSTRANLIHLVVFLFFLLIDFSSIGFILTNTYIIIANKFEFSTAIIHLKSKLIN